MASVTKRDTPKGKRYDVRYRDPAGKQRKKTFARKLDADRFASSTETRKLEGTYVDPQRARQTFESYAAEWLANQGYRERTHSVRERHLRLHINPHIGPMPLGQITPSAIKGFISRLEVDDNYRGQIYGTVDTILSAALADQLITRLPTRLPSNPRPAQVAKHVDAWPIEWVNGMHHQLGERYKIAVTLAVGLGLRQGEVFGLAAEDIDFLRGVVYVRRQVSRPNSRRVFAPPKGRREAEKSREVPLPEGVQAELAAYMKRFPPVAVELPWETENNERTHTANLILTTEPGNAVCRVTFNDKTWRPARKALGIPDTKENGMHALRHLYGSALIEAGVNPVQVAVNMGHKDVATTLRVYAHVLPSGVDQTKQAMNGFLITVRSADGAKKAQESQASTEDA